VRERPNRQIDQARRCSLFHAFHRRHASDGLPSEVHGGSLKQLPHLGIRRTLKPVVEEFGLLIFNVSWALVGEPDSADRIACEAFARIYQPSLDDGSKNVNQLRIVLLRHVVQISRKELFWKGLAEVLRGCCGLRPAKAGGVDCQNTSTVANLVVDKLRHVPFKLRVPLVLREVAELPITAVAQVLGATEQNVRRSLLEGRRALINALRRNRR
jgi:hypothetical protein